MEKRYRFGDVALDKDDNTVLIIGIDYSEPLHGGHYYALIQYPKTRSFNTWNHPESDLVKDHILNAVESLNCKKRLQWMCTEYLRRLPYENR